MSSPVPALQQWRLAFSVAPHCSAHNRGAFERLILEWVQEERQTRLLRFLECALGLPTLPGQGWDTPSSIHVRHALEATDSLPVFHYQTGIVDLPDYGSLQMLRARMESALLDVEEG